MFELKFFYQYICKGLMKIKSRFQYNNQLGYWDKLYDKYYEEYKSLSIKELRRLQSIKSVNYNVNLSYPWTTIFISAVLGAVVSNIINIFNFLSSDIPINLAQSTVDKIACGVIIAVILIPLGGYICLYVKEIYFFKRNILYMLFIAIILLGQFANKESYEVFVNNGVVLLFCLDVYIAIVTILDIRKQKIGIECSVIKDLILEKEEDNKIKYSKIHLQN
ncbi:MAG: hypothetical protein KHY11_00575 [Veillonella sp.]|uniref:hypothetical protein n=1 Tax=Veillonella sp. TaxID=1926307 RepID=UPI0025E0F723|nr:hypothetical protein [Veillonella sp.]MBS5335975.1 hypothetical protein [Veillonella sp.]